MKTAPVKFIVERLPFWNKLSPSEQASVSARASIKQFAKGQHVGGNSSVCLGIVLLLEGEIRVSMASDEGREITLYRAGENEVCISTASCVIRQLTFDVDVTALQDTTVPVVPASLCAQLMESNIYVKAFIFEKETERYSQTLWAMQQMLFKRLDQRLAFYFVEHYKKSGSLEIQKTQEEVARDVNSTREVVTRMLHEFAAKGLVKVKRGAMQILNKEGLEGIASLRSQ
ncbi:MAG: Crp/Fnr family transcriptional regulator [Fibrobacter sp.]|nr:Crp/Fnr family transcriptional regulator [Fibrobacter sp.]